MADRKLSELQREDDPASRARLLRARVRAGELSPARLRLAAWLGLPGAEEVCDEAEPAPEALVEWLDGLAEFGWQWAMQVALLLFAGAREASAQDASRLDELVRFEAQVGEHCRCPTLESGVALADAHPPLLPDPRLNDAIHVVHALALQSPDGDPDAEVGRYGREHFRRLVEKTLALQPVDGLRERVQGELGPRALGDAPPFVDRRGVPTRGELCAALRARGLDDEQALRERLRHGDVDSNGVALASSLGHAASRVVSDRLNDPLFEPVAPGRVGRWLGREPQLLAPVQLEQLQRWSARAVAMAALIALRSCRDVTELPSELQESLGEQLQGLDQQERALGGPSGFHGDPAALERLPPLESQPDWRGSPPLVRAVLAAREALDALQSLERLRRVRSHPSPNLGPVTQRLCANAWEAIAAAIELASPEAVHAALTEGLVAWALRPCDPTLL